MLPLEYSKMLIDKTAPAFSFDPNQDIMEFQNAGKDRLRHLLGLHNMKSSRTQSNIMVEYDKIAEDLDCREIRFIVESEKNVFVPCHLFIPKDYTNQPLIIALHGHSTGMHILAGRKKYSIDQQTIDDQNCDFAKQAINQGFAVLTLEHRGFGERGGNEKGSLCSELALRAIMIGRTLIGERVFDTMRVIDAVCSNFCEKIECSKIICIGYSGGGTIATYLSALDKRIYHSVIVSAISTFKDSIGAMPHCPCNYIPKIASEFDMGEICQLIAPRSLTIVSGMHDKLFPIHGAKESSEKAILAYQTQNAQNNLVHIITKGDHKFYPDEIWNHLKMYK